jgi:phosphoribosylformimino-5-aminoimidazole carboxamide ribonucleotide (ProFAR) isomerase
MYYDFIMFCHIKKDGASDGSNWALDRQVGKSIKSQIPVIIANVYILTTTKKGSNVTSRQI